MSVKKMLVLFSAILFVMSLCASFALAAAEPTLLQGCAWEENMDVFVSGELDVGNIRVEVSRQTAEVLDSGRLADKGATIRTTILLDISTSMPQTMRSKVKNYINLCIEKLGSGEELRLITFGDSMTVLQDFSSDRYDLSKAAEDISFNGQQSMIYDAIYQSLPDIQPVGGEPCFYRTIIITDGADESNTGVTKEELYLKLQQSTYPIEVIAVSEYGQKELSALTRISGGRYVNFQADSDPEQALLGTDDIIWVRVKLPSAILDGATRQFTISDGDHELRFDYKVPAYDAPAPAEPAETASSESTPTPSSDIQPEAPIPTPAVPTAAVSAPQTEKKNDHVIVIAAIGAVVAAALILVLALVLRKRKASGVSAEQRPAVPAPVVSDKTEIVVPTGGTIVRLRQSNDPDKIWELPLSEPITVGRDESCRICIPEGSVSRQQCILYLSGEDAVMIENKSGSNVTQLNKAKLGTPQRLQEGDQIACGRVVLVVDTIRAEAGGNPERINRLTQYVNV